LRFDRKVRYPPVEAERVTDIVGNKIELPQGTLELLILKTLALEARHGWSISERLHQISSATLQVRQGSIYPALHRLERRGWIKAEWGASDNKPSRQVLRADQTRPGASSRPTSWPGENLPPRWRR
jgi:hypothetical protein